MNAPWFRYIVVLVVSLSSTACARNSEQSPLTTWLYVVDAGGPTSRILRVRTDGSGLQTMLDPALPAARGIVFEPGTNTVYWTSRDGHRIQRARVSAGSGLRPHDVVTERMDSAYGIAIDPRNGYLYWSDYGTGAIHHSKRSGERPEAIVRGLKKPRGIDIDIRYGFIYWTDVETRKVQRARPDGSGVQDLLTQEDGLQAPYGVTVDASAGLIYIADAGTGHIMRARTDGSNLEILIRNSGPHPAFIAISREEGRIYWTDNRANRVRRALLNGEQIEDVIATGLAGPRGLVLVRH